MEESAPQPSDPPQEQPDLVALVRQLRDDAKTFAEAEAQYIKAAARERVFHAAPGLGMIAAAGSLAAGALVALLFGLMQVIAPRIGQGAAVTVVVLMAVAISALLGWMGTRRIRGAFKRPEDR